MQEENVQATLLYTGKSCMECTLIDSWEIKNCKYTVDKMETNTKTYKKKASPILHDPLYKHYQLLSWSTYIQLQH